MKTKVFYLASKVMVVVVLTIVLVVKALAGTSPKVSLVPFGTERALIAIENLSELPTELLIEDAEGNVVYYREGMASEDYYSKKFDFRNLDEGEYKVRAKNKNGENTLSFRVANNKIVVNKPNKGNNPYFEVKNGVLKLSMLNPSNEEVKLNLVNEDGILFSKELGSDFSITAGFNLNNLKGGEYAVEIVSETRNYNFNFTR